ncbi:MAG: InlB B-repeat-containing protein [Firmicutes bacterium]|nr:InlB B-repeat-containing protein [Bacillota bacterium]
MTKIKVKLSLFLALLFIITTGLTVGALFVTQSHTTAYASGTGFHCYDFDGDFIMGVSRVTPVSTHYSWINEGIDRFIDEQPHERVNSNIEIGGASQFRFVFGFPSRSAFRRSELMRVDGHITSWSDIVTHFSAETVEFIASRYSNSGGDDYELWSRNYPRTSGRWTYFVFRYEPSQIGSFPSTIPISVVPMLFHVTATYGFLFITYDRNGGTFINPPPVVFIDVDDRELPIPVREGHHFGGWFTNPLLTGSPITYIEKGAVGNLRLFAAWDIMIFSVRFMVQGYVWREATVPWGSLLSQIDGIHFQTWYFDENFRSVVDLNNVVVTEDIVLFGYYNPDFVMPQWAIVLSVAGGIILFCFLILGIMAFFKPRKKRRRNWR